MPEMPIKYVRTLKTQVCLDFPLQFSERCFHSYLGTQCTFLSCWQQQVQPLARGA